MLEKLAKQTAVYGHQHHTRKIPELPAHALLYPYLRAGVLWNHHRRICPHTVRIGAADARHGVGVLPLCRQGRSRRRRRAGCETAPLRNDLGHNVARSPDLLRADRDIQGPGVGGNGEAYAAHPLYVVIVAAIILFDVAACIPFSRLREQGRAMSSCRSSSSTS